MDKPRTPEDLRLTRDAIVEVALDLLDRDGLEALSLRRIADRFGVKTPALYWHLRDRAALHALMAETMLRESLARIAPDLVGWPWLEAFGRGLQAVQCARRDAPKLIAIAGPSEAMAGELLEAVIGAIVAGGVDRDLATAAQAAVQSFTLGWSLFVTNPPVDALMARQMDRGRAFEQGLRAIVRGFAEDGG